MSQSILGIEKEEETSFRSLVPEIPSTTYITHGMHSYPAKFIPQVVRWFIDNYTKPEDWIIDPFAGSGTVGVEAFVTRRNAACIDLNPIIEPLMNAKTYIKDEEIPVLDFDYSSVFEPQWSRIDYWYPNQILEILKTMWGFYYDYPHPLMLIALFSISRKFSYADDKIPKIFRSKRKIEWINEIVRKDYAKEIKRYYLKTITKYSNGCKGLVNQCDVFGKVEAFGDIDLLKFNPKRNYDYLLTSPPYGQAHEYIRSFKLELAWIGLKDSEITSLINKEIPYNRHVPDIDIMSETFERYRKKTEKKHTTLYDTYFKSILYILENLAKNINHKMGIFVGNATFGGVSPPFDKIFSEHLESCGLIHERTLIDRIKVRNLFRNRKNISPNGIEKEYLIIMKAK